jgi:hypothetical protein
MSRSQIGISWLSSNKALEFIYERHLALKPFHMQQVGFLPNFSGFSIHMGDGAEMMQS